MGETVTAVVQAKLESALAEPLMLALEDPEAQAQLRASPLAKQLHVHILTNLAQLLSSQGSHDGQALQLSLRALAVDPQQPLLWASAGKLVSCCKDQLYSRVCIAAAAIEAV